MILKYWALHWIPGVLATETPLHAGEASDKTAHYLIDRAASEMAIYCQLIRIPTGW